MVKRKQKLVQETEDLEEEIEEQNGIVEDSTADVDSEPVAISFDDQTSVPSRLAEALVKAKVESLQEQGVKALPLSVMRCAREYHGTPPTVFHCVELKTNYDFNKVESLQVDGENAQELVDPKDPNKFVLRAVAVVIKPTKVADLVFVFAYVYTKRQPLIRWSLTNTKGDQVTLVSYMVENVENVEKDSETQQTQQSCSMFIFPGCPAALCAKFSFMNKENRMYSDAKNSEALANSEKPAVQKEEPSGQQDNVTPKSRLQQLKDVWATMSVTERIAAMRFGKAVQPTVLRCYQAVTGLHEYARLSADLGFSTGLQGFHLVQALEFVPSPEGHRDRPVGLMFSPSLALHPNVWEVLDNALPGWGAQRKLHIFPPNRWPALFEPPASSWAQLEVQLARLLEQKFLGGLTVVLNERVKAASVAASKETKVAQQQAAKSRKGKKNVAAKAKTQRVAQTAANGVERKEGSVTMSEGPKDGVKRDIDAQAEENDAKYDIDSQAQAGTQEDEDEEGEQEEDTEDSKDGSINGSECCEDSNVIDVTSQIESAEDCYRSENADGHDFDFPSWQKVGPRRGRRGQVDNALSSPMEMAESNDNSNDTSTSQAPDFAQQRGIGAYDSSEKLTEKSERTSMPNRSMATPTVQCQREDPMSWRDVVLDEGYSTPTKDHQVFPSSPSLSTNGSATGEGAAPAIEQVARGWQASVCAMETANGPVDPQFWRSRRNENASWRLWYMETKKASPIKSPIKNDVMCLNCGGGRICGICDCSPDPWQAPASNAPAPGMPQTNPSSTPSDSTLGSSTDYNHLLSECFNCTGLDEDQLDENLVMQTPWRRLLKGPPPGLAPVDEPIRKDFKVQERRRRNAAWRHWWARHQNSPDRTPALPFFPPTPTSTCPPSPRSCDPYFVGPGPELGSATVYLPVPLELAAEVQQYVEYLKRMRLGDHDMHKAYFDSADADGLRPSDGH